MIFMIMFDKFQTNPINCIYVDYNILTAIVRIKSSKQISIQHEQLP